MKPGCPSSKRRYRDEIAAKLALAELDRKDKAGHTERRAYRCPQCGGWHLTSKPLKARNASMKQGTRIPAQSRRVTAAQPQRRKVRTEVFERDGYVCALVRLKQGHRCLGGLTPHHLRKASAGGSYTADNLLTLCAFGNGWVEDNPAEARALGLVL